MVWKTKKEKEDLSQLPDLPPLPGKRQPSAPSRTMVVKELPTQQVRKVEMEDGTIAELITIEEALETLLNRTE